MDTNRIEACARRLLRFAEQSCRGESPLYEQVCSRTADDAGLLQIVRATPDGQPVPNLFLAAVHFLLLSGTEHELGGFYRSCVTDPKPPEKAFPGFRDFCLANEAAIRSLIEHRRVQTNEVRRCAYLLPAFSYIAVADDLDKIDRTINGQPAYASKVPKYCLLVFGPKAQTRVWLVLDLAYDPLREKPGAKDMLYADLNGNGDLNDPEERVPATVVTKKSSKLGLPTNIGRLQLNDDDKDVPHFHVGDVSSRDGKTMYGELVVEVGWYILGRKDRQVRVSVDVPGHGRQSVGGNQLWFTDSPSTAPVIWFDGALTMRLAPSGILHLPVDYTGKEPPPPWYKEFPLVRGKTMALRAEVGSAWVGLGTFLAIPCDLPSEEIHPVAQVVFQHADPEKPPIEVSVNLNVRTCEILFEGSITVPTDATLGKAEVTLSFPGWRGGLVEPAVSELEVSDKDTRPKAFRDE